MNEKAMYLKAEINNIVKGVHYMPVVAVDIYGVKCYKKEVEVRALQLIAKRRAEISDEAFKEFTDNVIVYSGKSRRKCRKMHFRKDGKFVENFDKGFYTATSDLAFEIL